MASPVSEKPSALIEVKQLYGVAIQGLDGEIGRVDELLFDDEFWTVRYLIVNTGGWLAGRKVLISPMALGKLDWNAKRLNVNLTCEQIKNSPGVETDQPVSRQWEMRYYDYYALPYYWTGVGGWGAYWYPANLLSKTVGDAHTKRQEAVAQERANAQSRARKHADAHLRSSREVTGYGVESADGHLGHIEDFIVSDETWEICSLSVFTQSNLSGEKLALSPDCVTMVSWPDRVVGVNIAPIASGDE